jgi:Ca-activated chloride channel homolog
MEGDVVKRGAGRILAGSFLISVIFMLSSCGAVEPHFSAGMGNYAYSRGDFQKANIYYLRAYESGTYQEWIAYNLGNVYAALGEYEAAAAEWGKGLSSENEDLLFHLSFNRGVLAYEQAGYEEAFDLFKRALLLRPSSMEAKINLEHTLDKLEGRNPAMGKSREARPIEERQVEDDVDRMLEYIRRKEAHRWAPADEEEKKRDSRDW